MNEYEDIVEWPVCNCGCGGIETTYRERYLLAFQADTGSYYLFSRHNGIGRRVGLHEYKDVHDLSQGVRENYTKFEKVPELKWRLCKCERKCTRWTLSHKKMRFYARWNTFLRRVELMKTHYGKETLGKYRLEEIDDVVRALAREPRRTKRVRKISVHSHPRLVLVSS